MTTSQKDLLEKIKENFTDEQQKIFVDSFYCYLNEPKGAFIIDLNKVWPWLGFKTKGNCKTVLNKFFIENKDYMVKKETASAAAEAVSIVCQSLETACAAAQAVSKQNGGQNKETILMSVATFKDLCLTSNTKKAKEVRGYFLKLEEIVFDTIKESHLKTTEIHKQLGQSDYMIKHFHTKSILYLGHVEQNEESQIVKYGHTSDIKSTYRRHQQSYGNEFKFLHAVECKEHYKLESMIKSHNDLQTRHIKIYNEQPRQELIRLDHHFDLNKFIELINDMQVSLKNVNQNDDDLMSKIKILELESQVKLQEETTKQMQIEAKIQQEKTKQMEIELRMMELKMLQVKTQTSKPEHIQPTQHTQQIQPTSHTQQIQQIVNDSTKEEQNRKIENLVKKFMETRTEHSVRSQDHIYISDLHHNFEVWYDTNKPNDIQQCIPKKVFNEYLVLIGYPTRIRRTIDVIGKNGRKLKKTTLPNRKFI